LYDWNACKIGMLKWSFVYSLIHKKRVWVLNPGMFDPQQFLFNLAHWIMYLKIFRYS